MSKIKWELSEDIGKPTASIAHFMGLFWCRLSALEWLFAFWHATCPIHRRKQKPDFSTGGEAIASQSNSRSKEVLKRVFLKGF